MKTISKYLIVTVMAVLLGTLFLFPAYAADYKIKSIEWTSDDRGAAVVTWTHSEKTADKTAWTIRLYRGADGKAVSKWFRTSVDYVDFSTLISRTGTGRYFVEVYPVEGGDEMKVTSEYLIVDGEELDRIKKWVKAKSEETTTEITTVGWIRTPAGTWAYRYANGTYAVGWRQIDNQTYYFSTEGRMLDGWQIINNRWYYFVPEKGNLLRNATTPEGLYVDGDGILTVDGVQVDASFQPKNTTKNAAKTLTNLTKIKITSKETKVEPHVVRPMKVTSDGKFSIETYEFSKPYEEWEAGVPIMVTCTICANTGYCFTDDTEVTFNRGKLVSFTGNSVERVVEYVYYPRLVLASPTNVVLDETDKLSWTPVKDAVRYIIRVFEDGERLTDIYTTTNSYDLNEFAYNNSYSFSLTAIARESVRNYYYDSFETKIPDADTIRISGYVSQTGDTITYRDTNDLRVSGWVEFSGNWMHFTQGKADGPGWWQDNNGLWYFFDGNHHMMTGEITLGDQYYVLNDGRTDSVPLGAWIE